MDAQAHQQPANVQGSDMILPSIENPGSSTADATVEVEVLNATTTDNPGSSTADANASAAEIGMILDSYLTREAPTQSLGPETTPTAEEKAGTSIAATFT